MPQEGILTDSQNETCALVQETEDRTLQAIFDIPYFNPTNTITVGVLIKDEDCCSPAWTWFTGPSCSSNMFRECAVDRGGKFGAYSHCRVTCVCHDFESCGFVHFKYIFDQHVLNVKSALCEVTLVYGDVKVPYYGTEWNLFWLDGVLFDGWILFPHIINAGYSLE